MNNLQLRLIDYADMIMDITDQVSKWSKYSKIVEQLNKSCTSVGANYAEAQSASSRKDFHNKIRIALKEARETEHWLMLLQRREPNLPSMDKALSETIELIKILVTISKKTK